MPVIGSLEFLVKVIDIFGTKFLEAFLCGDWSISPQTSYFDQVREGQGNSHFQESVIIEHFKSIFSLLR